MALTSLILGIIAVVLSIVPFCNYVGLLPAVFGIIFGVIALTRREEPQNNNRTMAITGIVFCTLAIVISIVWSFLLIFPLRYVIY